MSRFHGNHVSAGSRAGGDPTTLKSTLDASMIAPSDQASTKTSAALMDPRISGFVSHNFQATHSKSLKPVRNKTDPQYSTNMLPK